ncbi:hypothetical protein I3843_06G016400 [Carya illinoinensis]|nr:hypothetical protein I3843_06G016400 [Carya illinoinensis]
MSALCSTFSHSFLPPKPNSFPSPSLRLLSSLILLSSLLLRVCIFRFVFGSVGFFFFVCGGRCRRAKAIASLFSRATMKLEPPSSSHHRAAQLLRVTSPTVPLFFLGFMHYKRRCKIRAPCSKGMSAQEMPVALMCSDKVMICKQASS